MDISLRTQQLNSLFSYDKKAHLEESRLEIIPFRFTQTIGASEINEFQKGLATMHKTEKYLFRNFSETELCLMRRFFNQLLENINTMPGIVEEGCPLSEKHVVVK